MDFLQSLNLEDLPEQQTCLSLLMEQNVTDVPNLGVDACCSCGSPEVTLACPNCKRIKYCSESCRHQDATHTTEDDNGALGHTAIICRLLKIASQDDDVDNHEESTPAARQRVRSEYESYPATLSNILASSSHVATSSSGRIVIHVRCVRRGRTYKGTDREERHARSSRARLCGCLGRTRRTVWHFRY